VVACLAPREAPVLSSISDFLKFLMNHGSKETQRSMKQRRAGILEEDPDFPARLRARDPET
jgi:hypothetical protein